METTARRGLIDTLAAGFGALHRHILLILIPIAVDAFLWLGPKLSLGPLLPPTPSSGPVAQPLFALLDSMNVLGLLSIQVPSVVGYTLPTTDSGLQAGGLHSWFLAAPLLLLLTGLGILVASLYLGAIANAVRGEIPRPQIMILWTVVHWVRFSGFAVIAPTAALLVLFLIQVGASLATLLVTLLLLIASFYLFFAVDALFMSRVGPLEALRYGSLVARRFFWPALSLFLLVSFIVLGTWLLWLGLAVNLVGLIVAIVGNAYIATGLIAAGMVFYQDRVRLLQEEAPAD